MNTKVEKKIKKLKGVNIGWENCLDCWETNKVPTLSIHMCAL